MRTRIIAKLDVKPPYVVKPIHFEGLRKIGITSELAKKYYKQGADEIMYIDIVSSLYQRDIVFNEIEKTANELFIPFGVGGAIRSLEDISKLFHIGADKVVINTYAVQENPEIINKAAEIFGNQAIVINIEAKKWGAHWECYTDCGRIRSGRDVLEWAKEVESRGAGEILLTSMDCDGTKDGFDLELTRTISENLEIPVIASGGAGNLDHFYDVFTTGKADAALAASIFHFKEYEVAAVKDFLADKGIVVRKT